MVIKIEGEGVKVLGGGTQAYNKDTTDKRRPLIMKSPHERQKILRIAKDPIYKDLLKKIENYKEEIVIYEELIDTLQKAHDEELEIRHTIIKDLETKIKGIEAAKSSVKQTTRPARKKAAPKKAIPKKSAGE